MASQPLGALVQILKAERILSAIDLSQMNAIGPYVVVPAPGAGKLIVPIAAFVNYQYGGKPYYAAADTITLAYGGSNTPVLALPFSGLLTDAPNSLFSLALADLGGVDQAVSSNANQALVISSADDYVGGAIATSAIHAPGVRYALGDTGTITNGANDATYVITGVGVLGIVTGYSIVDAGTACTAAANNATVDAPPQAGIGMNFTININSIAPGNGTLKVVIYYQILDVA